MLTPLDFYSAGPGLESPHGYRPGGYHPIHLGDIYDGRYKVINKLGSGTHSTVWLACDLKSTLQTRYVALKFVVAELTGKNNEIKIHRILASQGGTHPGSDHVLAPLDHFNVHGPNGEHDVLVFKVIGPQLMAMYSDDPDVIHHAIKPLAHQIALGVSFLHDCGVVHADLHNGNIVFEIPGFDGKTEKGVVQAIGFPKCVPVFTQYRSHPDDLHPDNLHLNDSFPKYMVLPTKLVDIVDQGDLRIKIIDLGEAFFSTEVPQNLHTPLQVRAPEAIINNLQTLSTIGIGSPVDVWSMGCLIYELATSRPLVCWSAHDEIAALSLLTTVLGPLPVEWMDLLGKPCSARTRSTRSTALERRVVSTSKVDDTPGLITLLQEILVFDPLRRSRVSDLLNHPWFVGASHPATLFEPISERDFCGSEGPEPS